MKKLGLIAFLLSTLSLQGQDQQAYFISFTAKENLWQLQQPTTFLSDRAIARRERQGITLGPTDIPVSNIRRETVENIVTYAGHTSKWLNGIYVEAIPSELAQIQNLPFVAKVQPITGGTATHGFYGYAESQNDQINLEAVQQNLGYELDVIRGEGMLIAVLDAGFVGANSVNINDNLNILTTRNFVEGGTDVYQGSSHGFSVLSTMATFQPDFYVGTAPEASYALIKTEKELSETREEMFNWIAGAEFADSIGADIINSSLGYSTFDDPADDYTVNDLDGRTSIISLGALAAARTGMLVVTSAGNAGGSSWDKITFPADADSVLTVGSVNQYGMASAFSSRGYTVDGRVKPNICARGEGAYVFRPDGQLAWANGTSFSSPIMAGAAACLWQTQPNATAQQIIKALETSASHYYSHNMRIGYGIPNLGLAKRNLDVVVGGEVPRTLVYPNPFADYVELFLPDGEALDIELELYDLMDRKVAEGTLAGKRYQTLWSPGDHVPPGMYILYLRRGNEFQRLRVIKTI
ncbi:MAG: S8 family peptidase [Schleiferiaceae bacterium]|nr:S8 family peptidase [Schleiferiaceae bacterium]